MKWMFDFENLLKSWPTSHILKGELNIEIALFNFRN
jgi:hypothetical protein